MKHCLVVAESAVIRKVARRILEALSFDVSEAEDGKTGIVACERRMPNAVFLDEAAPAVDGQAFLKELRRLPGGGAAKVVFCAVENEVAALARAKHAGADEFILKPFDRASVTATFQAVGLV